MKELFIMPDESWKFWFVGDKDADRLEVGKATLICEKEGVFWYWYGGENPPYWGGPFDNAVQGGNYEKTEVISREHALRLLDDEKSRRV